MKMFYSEAFEKGYTKRYSDIKAAIASSESKCTTTEGLARSTVLVQEGSRIAQYRADQLKLVYSPDELLLTQQAYISEYLFNEQCLPGIRYLPKFQTTAVIQLHPPGGPGAYKTYLAENLISASMLISSKGEILSPVLHKWEHKIIDLPVVNLWTKENLQELTAMRKNAKALQLVTPRKCFESKVQAFTSDIADFLVHTATESAVQRLIACEGIKNTVAKYMEDHLGLRSHIKTYFDTYEELEEYKATRLNNKESV